MNNQKFPSWKKPVCTGYSSTCSNNIYVHTNIQWINNCSQVIIICSSRMLNTVQQTGPHTCVYVCVFILWMQCGPNIVKTCRTTTTPLFIYCAIDCGMTHSESVIIVTIHTRQMEITVLNSVVIKEVTSVWWCVAMCGGLWSALTSLSSMFKSDKYRCPWIPDKLWIWL